MTKPQPEMPPCREIAADADHSEQGGACITYADGRHSCPSEDLMIALFARQANAPRMVNLRLSRDRFGLHVNYTPEGAREIARALIDTADQVEMHNAAMASAQLGIALGKPIMDPQEIERRVSASRNIGEPAEPAPHMPPQDDGPGIPIMLGLVAGLFIAAVGAFKLLAMAMLACRA